MRKGNSGFSLVEILVVVTIILVMTAGSVSLLSVFMRGQGIKQAGRIIGSQFATARQRSVTEKVTYFLELDTRKQVMRLYRDTDPDGPVNMAKGYDGKFDPAVDTLAGDEHPLPNHIQFACDQAGVAAQCITSTGTYATHAQNLVIAFHPDGSSSLTGAAFEIGFDPDTAPKSDLMLVQEGQTQRLFIDINLPSGKIRKQAYRVN